MTEDFETALHFLAGIYAAEQTRHIQQCWVNSGRGNLSREKIGQTWRREYDRMRAEILNRTRADELGTK